MTSRAIQRALDALELDAGVTYLESEPLEHVRKLPLYRERYVFVARRDHAASRYGTITWREGRRNGCVFPERGHAEQAHHRLADGDRSASASTRR